MDKLDKEKIERDLNNLISQHKQGKEIPWIFMQRVRINTELLVDLIEEKNENMNEFIGKHKLLESVCSDYENLCEVYKQDFLNQQTKINHFMNDAENKQVIIYKLQRKLEEQQKS